MVSISVTASFAPFRNMMYLLSSVAILIFLKSRPTTSIPVIESILISMRLLPARGRNESLLPVMERVPTILNFPERMFAFLCSSTFSSDGATPQYDNAGLNFCSYRNLMKRGRNTSDTMDISFISMFSDGPDVSLHGSPTVSPTTAAL